MMNAPDMREELSLAAKVTRVAFIFYVVFMLVGAAMPFEDGELADEIASSNPINQVVDSVIPLVCLVCLWPRRRDALDILRHEKYLTFFLLWCAATVLWSEFPLNSLKGSVRIVGSTIVALAFFVHARSTDEALKYIRAVLAIYIPVTFISIALVPAATQWEWPAWRGLAEHKNTLGEIALFSTLVWVAAISRNWPKGRMWSSVFALASLTLVIGSKSVTAWMTLLLVLFFYLCHLVLRSAGPAIAGSAAGCCCVIALMIFFNGAGLESVFATVGRDTTFTGRTDVWQEMMFEAKAHPVLGAGFAGFWTEDRDFRVSVADGNTYRPSSGHQGYLDLWNETGLVGICALALMIVFYFRNTAKVQGGSNVWTWIFISVLIINTTESTLFRVGNLAAWLFVLSYLSLYARMSKQNV